ncbi:SOS response-associated peptidase [Pseudomonas aeruginosa]|uniref:SOS response-associated peptidase n=1 Tax=Pseudomonas aeruginosa TaxID=287 RepID=UPI0021AED2FF|nr:SOS response-associated peptidase [Pseudomonas aeruginosa]
MPVILAPEQWAAWLSPETLLEQAYDAIALSRLDFETYRISLTWGTPETKARSSLRHFIRHSSGIQEQTSRLPSKN